MVSEFQFIENIKSQYSVEKIGDDCAVLPKDSVTDLLLTADMLVEDIDFRLDWTTPEFLGHKALAVSLSDIAAMGGEPKWAMLSIGIPTNVWNTRFIDRFYEGWFTLARQHGVELVGGDVSRSPDKIILDSIVGGEAPKGKAILRSRAKPGDSIYVTGFLGGAAGGLMLLESGSRAKNSNKTQKELINRQLRPIPQITIGKQLLTLGLPSAMIDISDGLSSDLEHICRPSGVGARLEAKYLPVDANLGELAMTDKERTGLAINGGEDFELLFTSHTKEISPAIIPGIHHIGEVTANTEIIEIVDGGKSSILPFRGYRHF